MTVDELDESAALARRNLDVSDLAKALEERSEFIFGDIARQATNKNSGIVGIGELVHLSGWIIATIREAALNSLRSPPHGLLRNASHHRAASVVSMSAEPALVAAGIVR